MERSIAKEKNIVLYPLQNVIGYLVHIFLLLIKPFVIGKFKERLLKIEESKTFNNVIGLAVFNALGGLVMMLTNIKIANVLGAGAYGLYSYYLAIGEVGANVVRYGRHKTMTRDLIQKPPIFNSLISNTFIIGLINFLFVLVVVFLFRHQLDVETSLYAFLLIMAPCIGALDFQPVYESLKEISWHSIFYFIQRVSFMVAVWICICFVSQLSLSFLGVTLFLSWLIIEIIQYREIVVGLGIKIQREISWTRIWELYKSNFIIALSCLVGVAFGPAIRLILMEFADSNVVGVYSAGMQIFLISQFLMHQVSRVGNPLMAEAGKEGVSLAKRKTLCHKYFVIMFVTAIPFAIPLILFPQFITDICFTKEYSALGAYLPIFAIYLMALSIGNVYAQFLLSMRKEKVYFIIYIGSAVATVLSAIILIPLHPLLGAILALCIPQSISCLFYYICSVKYLKRIV